jgi:catechol 2,3-dioxygenase-like lactoylglutathione lyase family enzyme
MHIAPKTTGIHHVALRSGNLARAHAFYNQTMGFPIVLETWDSFVALAGNTVIIVRGPDSRTADGDRFSSFRVGLDHVALGCQREEELERVASALEAANVPSTGIRFDPVLQRRYVAFRDPDGIAWEFYMAPNVAVEVVERYFEALRKGTLMEVPFADDVTFESPMIDRVTGRGAVVEALKPWLSQVRDVSVHDHLVDGDCVATRFELKTSVGRLEVFGRFKIVNGLLAEIRSFFDSRQAARPVLGGPQFSS